MAKLHPQNGGCWWCWQDDETELLYAESEFDCFVHLSCLRKNLEKDDAEAEIMKYLLVDTTCEE